MGSDKAITYTKALQKRSADDPEYYCYPVVIQGEDDELVDACVADLSTLQEIDLPAIVERESGGVTVVWIVTKVEECEPPMIGIYGGVTWEYVERVGIPKLAAKYPVSSIAVICAWDDEEMVEWKRWSGPVLDGEGTIYGNDENWSLDIARQIEELFGITAFWMWSSFEWQEMFGMRNAA